MYPMEPQLLHIFRNTPFGRETLLQSIDFCRKVKTTLAVYIPKHIKFLLYFENDVVQVDLDKSYLASPGTAASHAIELCEQFGIRPIFIEPKNFTSPTLPDIPTHFHFMTCPESISDLSSGLGLGYMGPRVSRIVNAAQFPVLMTCPVYKEWRRIAVFFGGSANAVRSLNLGFRISKISGLPMTVYTHLENRDRQAYENMVKEKQLEQEMSLYVDRWHFFESGSFEDHLYDVPYDALVIVGAFGHGLIKDFVFGSKMQIIQSVLPNNLLIVGPGYRI